MEIGLKKRLRMAVKNNWGALGHQEASSQENGGRREGRFAAAGLGVNLVRLEREIRREMKVPYLNLSLVWQL